MIKHKKVFRIILSIVVIVISISSLTYNTTYAYLSLTGTSGATTIRLQSGYNSVVGTTASVFYAVDPNIDSAVRLPYGTIDQQVSSSLMQWNSVSALTLKSTSWYYPNFVGQQNFATAPNDCIQNNLGWANIPAVTCLVDNGGNTMASFHMYLNTALNWNTNGTMNNTSNPLQADVLTILLHEFGHVEGLDHNNTYPCSNHNADVMCVSWTTKQSLSEDDKQGTAEVNGPYTDWEGIQPNGLVNTVGVQNPWGTLINNVNGAELSPRYGEYGVPVFSGSRYEGIDGYANSNYSYAYMSLFSSSNDNNNLNIGQRNYLTIQNGMKLRWFQYNYQQTTVSIDLLMTDGSSLRDSGLVDQNGIRVHPAFRTYYWTGGWMCQAVDLSPLAGKTIRSWQIGYDNNHTGTLGSYRSYIDSLTIDYTSHC